MAKYRCKSCRYRFTPREELTKSCPYCGKVGTLQEEPDAEELLRDISLEE